jgi:hypothetical protein
MVSLRLFAAWRLCVKKSLTWALPVARYLNLDLGGFFGFTGFSVPFDKIP